MSKQNTYIKTFKLLFPYLWPTNRKDLKKRVFYSTICLLLAKVTSVFIPIILGKSVDSLSDLENFNTNMFIPITLIIGYGFLRISSFVFNEIRDALFSKVSQHAIRSVSLNVFKHLHSLPLEYHLNRQTGALSRFIDRGTKGIDFLLRYVVFNVFPTFLEIILVAIILFVLYGFSYALVTFLTISIYIIITLKITKWRIKFRRDMNNADNNISTKMIDSLINYETVKYFNNEKHEHNKLDISLKDYEEAANKNRHSLSFLNISQTITIMTGITIMLIMSAYGIKNNLISIGGFVVINTYMLQLYQPLNFLGSVYREIRQSLIDMENMFNLLDEKNIIKNSTKKININGKNEIIFHNVSFSYNKKRSIIKNISFKVLEGKKLAIVGSTGAGKSTISRLLFKFYELNSGKITINNEDIKNISNDFLRNLIGVVPQDTILFNDTIYYNILYGKPDAKYNEIIKASVNAGIHNFINNLPDKYNTVVGERGLKLSGGEKQRISIARTFLKNPKILFFDEATSALDSQTERKIQSNLKKISKNRTTLIITHRLSSANFADEIIVLEKGTIIERGNHSSLLKLKGKYFQMYKKQKI